MSIRRISLGLAALVLGAAPSVRADAPGDAWAAAKGVLPATPAVVMGLNVSTIKSSAIFQKLYPTLLEQAGEARAGLDEVKTTCGIDLKDAVQGVVVWVDDANKGAIFLSLKGVDKNRVGDCLTKMAAKSKKSFRATDPDAQGIVEYSGTDTGDKKLYVAYLPHGVVVIATDPNEKGLLSQALSGHGVDAASDTGKALSGTNTGAAVWAVIHKPQPLDDGVTMKVGYGMADLTGGMINGEMRLILGSAKEAGAAVAKATTEFENAKKNNQVPPQLANMAKTLKIGCTVGPAKQGACGTPEMQVKASLAEKEALALLEHLMGGPTQ
jgi:hypothetical protein